jgi:hypothetical protein
MHERSLKRFLGMVLVTLVLASFTLAGDTQCPDAPPPPKDGDGLVIINTNPPVKEDVQFLKGFWEILVRGTGLF